MSALGHKRTCAVQNGMSALHPKADMCDALTCVRGHMQCPLYPRKRTSVASGRIEPTYSFSLNQLCADFKPFRRAPIRAAMSSLVAQEFDRALGPPCSHAAF